MALCYHVSTAGFTSFIHSGICRSRLTSWLRVLSVSPAFPGSLLEHCYTHLQSSFFPESKESPLWGILFSRTIRKEHYLWITGICYLLGKNICFLSSFCPTIPHCLSEGYSSVDAQWCEETGACSWVGGLGVLSLIPTKFFLFLPQCSHKTSDQMFCTETLTFE